MKPLSFKVRLTVFHTALVAGFLGVAAVSGILASPLAAWPQSPPRQRPPTFGVDVEAIRLSVSVTDARSRYIGGLSQADFAVFEDGVHQPLSLFMSDPLPLSVVLLIDCSGSMEEKLPVAQQAGTRFTQALRPEDVVRVAQFSDRITVLQNFTADLRALEAAIRRTRANGPTVLYNALYVTMKELGRQRQVSARRSAIVLLSDGEDTASLATDEQVLELARQAEIGVYVISLRPDRPLDRERIAFSQATHFLTVLARDTGGLAYFPNSLSELDAVYSRIAEELSSQYTLGYVSQNARRDGRWRRIVVRTPGRDVQVRHKLGYYGARG